MSEQYLPTYIDNVDNSISIVDSSDSISYYKTENKINTLSAKNIANKKVDDNLNLCAFDGSNFNPVITINNNNSNCQINNTLSVLDNMIGISTNNPLTKLQLGPIWNNNDIATFPVDSNSIFINNPDNNNGVNDTSFSSVPIIDIIRRGTSNNWHSQRAQIKMGRYQTGTGDSKTQLEFNLFDKNSEVAPVKVMTLLGSGEVKVDRIVNIGSYGQDNCYLQIKTYNIDSYASIFFGCYYCTFGQSSHSQPYIRHKSQSSGGLESNYAISSSSDDRIKIDEELILDATNTLLKLRPQKYKKFTAETIEKAQEHIKNNSHAYIIESGLIAQEIFYEVPELRFLLNNIPDESNINATTKNFADIKNDPDYSNWSNHISTVNYTGLIPYLIQGFKEQQTEINTLKTENIELKSIIDKLKTANSFEEFKQTL